MSAENYLRTETVHIDEASSSATGSLQWFAENKNQKGNATHPITHNNKLTIIICGQASFASIAKDISEAKGSVDLVCWGFDPGMELVRSESNWPRGATYGDLLIEAGRRGVKVRLLIWYSFSGGHLQKHMPGYSHDTSPWRTLDSELEVQQINAKHSLALIREHARDNRHKKEWNVSGDKLSAMARKEYCHSWYKAVFKGRLTNVEIRIRDGDCEKIEDALKLESFKPDFTENVTMAHFGTHHQKPVLIDFDYQGGRKAVGYVMGLNSVTDYWDTTEHCVEHPLREQGGEKTLNEQTQSVAGKFDYETLKPYRDYACRVEGGRALIPLHENFERAWRRSGGDSKAMSYKCVSAPPCLLTKAVSGDSTAQIVRTQPEECDFTIKEVYFNATRVAAAGAGYLYMENQYFQYQDWADHLLEMRKKVIAGWNRNCKKIGKTVEDIPIMHVFVVIPVPERAQMIPRTYETLAALGQQGGLTGQVKMIDDINKEAKLVRNGAAQPTFGNAIDGWVTVPSAIPEVVVAANQAAKPTSVILESTFGLRVCVAVLNACEFNQAQRRWRYREIYIHSKLLLVDDGFFTLGSANLNQRSMAVDSEINIASNDVRHATTLRKQIWSRLAGAKNDGGNCTRAEIAQTFNDWVALMTLNKSRQKDKSLYAKNKQMEGFIVPLDDGRSSTLRLA